MAASEGSMTLRTRMLLAFGVVALVPIALLAFGLRQEITKRFSEEYQSRLDAVVEVIRVDLQREGDGISQRLASLQSALQKDNIFRLAAVAGIESERNYLIDYAGSAMRLNGLSMLQVQDADGLILSSGHFRNEHGRLEPELTRALASTRDGVALLTTRVPEGEFISLARAESFHIGNRAFTLVGGLAVDETFLSRFARDRATVSLLYHGRGLSSHTAGRDTDPAEAAVGGLDVRWRRGGAEERRGVVPARLRVT